MWVFICIFVLSFVKFRGSFGGEVVICEERFRLRNDRNILRSVDYIY